MTTTLHVLSIGSQDSCNTVRDVLLQRHNCRLSVVTSLWDMYAIPQQNHLDIAILHHTLSRLQIRDASEYIRRRWPRAKILVISAEMDVPDDPLYDEWAPPGQSSGTLLAMIEQLTGGAKERCVRNI
jgi:DNA-binding NtrC family response regulator